MHGMALHSALVTALLVRKSFHPWVMRSNRSSRLSVSAHQSKDRILHAREGQQNKQRQQRGEARYHRLEQLRFLEQPPLGPADVKELAGLRSRGDPYDAKHFTSDHADFKSRHNDAFICLAERLGGRHQQPGEQSRRCPVFYLDGADGATTSALLAASFDRETELYMANEWEESVETLRSPPFLLGCQNCLLGRAQDVLGTESLREVPFVAAYLDMCSGSTNPIVEMITLLFSGVLAPSIAIGFTLTAAEPTGRELIDRVQDVTRATMVVARERGYDMRHVLDDPVRFGVDPGLRRKHEGITTCWLVCSKARRVVTEIDSIEFP
jgi:hypothetical protein